MLLSSHKWWVPPNTVGIAEGPLHKAGLSGAVLRSHRSGEVVLTAACLAHLGHRGSHGAAGSQCPASCLPWSGRRKSSIPEGGCCALSSFPASPFSLLPTLMLPTMSCGSSPVKMTALLFDCRSLQPVFAGSFEICLGVSWGAPWKGKKGNVCRRIIKQNWRKSYTGHISCQD